MKSKEVLAEGGFNLRKFFTNSFLLSHRVESLEKDVRNTGSVSRHKVVEEDKRYTKNVLGDKHADGEQQFLAAVIL